MSYEHHRSQQVELDRSWPGLAAGPDEIEVDPETLASVAARLRDELDQPTRVTPPALEAACALGMCTGWFGYWATGGYMEHSLQTAGGSIAFYYRKVLEQVEAAAALFDATAQDYESADRGNRAGLEAAGGWDRLAAEAQPTAVPPAGRFRDSTRVPYIDRYEEVEGYDAAWIADEMRRLKDGQTWTQIADAGNALDSAADRLSDVADMLRGRAGTLGQQWSSETSVACQKALQRIAGTANELATASRRVSEFTHRSADTLRDTVLGFSDDRGLMEQAQDLLTIRGDPNRDERAREALALLNETYRDVNYTTLPPYVNADLPDLPSPGDSTRRTGGTSSGGFVPPSPSLSPVRPMSAPPSASSQPTSISQLSEGFAGTVPAALAPTLEMSQPGPGRVAEDVAGGGLAGAGGPASIGPWGSLPGPTGDAGGAGAGGVPGGGAPGAAPPGPLGTGGLGVLPGTTAGAGRGGADRGRSGLGGRPGALGGVVPTGSGGTTSTAGRQSGGRTGIAGNVGGWPRGSGGNAAAGTGGSGATGAMMPTAGGVRGTDREKASRPDSWLLEDDDPWRADDDVPPPVLR